MLHATWKSLLSRKLRLVLSGMAVVLGVMAVAGALILTQSMSASFDSMFRTINKSIAVQVTGKQAVGESQAGEGQAENVPAAVRDKIRAVPGVASAEGSVFADGARVVAKNGKVIPGTGPPRFGANWTGEDELVKLRAGRGPTAEGEVAINGNLADKGPFAVGDTIEVLTQEPKKTFTVVGIFGYGGDRKSMGGETTVAFTEPVAQKLMLGETGVYTTINVTAAGTSATKLRDDVRAALGDRYTVRTGDEVAKAQSAGVQEFLTLFQNFLLGFAAIALFVGVFLILNTFSILVAQRTGELALLRSLGAGRRQVIGSVLLEAVVIGVIASTLGLGAGYGIAALLKAVLFGDALPDAGLTVPLAAVIASYTVGILVTVLAAIIPAVRASRVAPIAAMREASDPTRPMTRLVVAGGLLFAAGAAGVGWALAGHLGDKTWLVLLGGVLLSFVGVAMLTPAVARPVVSLIGRVFSWSLPGKLGRRNSARNPRRTAITAATLMIGLALVTGVSVLASSLKSSIDKLVTRDVGADLIISGQGGGRGMPTYDPAVIDKTRQVPGVAAAVALYTDAVNDPAGKPIFVQGTDVPALTSIFNLKTDSGELRALRHGEMVVDDQFARRRSLAVGSTMTLRTAKAGETFTVVGVYKATQVIEQPVISVADATAMFRNPMPATGFVKLTAGADLGTVKSQVDVLLKDSPEVSVVSQRDFVDQQAGQVDQFVTMLYVLLALAIIIAVLGIVNTLALSVLERTRELGLLRAVGLGRWASMRMITVESVVISVFGALLGLGVGVGLGTAVVRALKTQGFEVLTLPWARMGVFLALAVVVGLVAAILPAIRAARVNVLRAISYE